MRNAWKGAAAAALWLGLLVPAQAEPRDLSGEYVMSGKGVGENDLAYAGTCTLKAVDTSVRSLVLQLRTKHSYVGKGIRLGDQLSTVIGDLCRAIINSVYAGEYLVVYRRAADGSLKGRWVHALSGAHGEETLDAEEVSGLHEGGLVSRTRCGANSRFEGPGPHVSRREQAWARDQKRTAHALRCVRAEDSLHRRVDQIPHQRRVCSRWPGPCLMKTVNRSPSDRSRRTCRPCRSRSTGPTIPGTARCRPRCARQSRDRNRGRARAACRW